MFIKRTLILLVEYFEQLIFPKGIVKRDRVSNSRSSKRNYICQSRCHISILSRTLPSKEKS